MPQGVFCLGFKLFFFPFPNKSCKLHRMKLNFNKKKKFLQKPSNQRHLLNSLTFYNRIRNIQNHVVFNVFKIKVTKPWRSKLENNIPQNWKIFRQMELGDNSFDAAAVVASIPFIRNARCENIENSSIGCKYLKMTVYQFIK